MTTVFFLRKDIMEAKGLKPPKLYDPDVVEFAKKTKDPAKDLWGFGQTLNRSDDGDGFMSNILWDYGGGVWDKEGKPALGTSFLAQNTAALQFAVDTIQKHKIQPPGVMGWTDVSNNESYMAGKLVTTNNGASLYYAMVNRKHDLAAKTLCVLTPGGPAGSFVGSSCYNWAIFQKSQHAELAEDLIRYVEDEKRFEEYLQVSIGQAGPVYKGRVDHPYWKSDPNFEAMVQNILRSVNLGHPGPMTPAAAEVQGQKILTDMAGRVVVGGLTPERRSRKPTRGSRRSTRSAAGLSGGSFHGDPRGAASRGRGAGQSGRLGVGLGRVLGPDYRLGFLFVLPIVLLVLALVAYPFVYAVYLSLTRKYVGVPPVFVGLENYIRLTDDGFFRRAVVNSFIFTFASVGIKLLLGMGMALVLTSRIRWRGFWTGVLLIPWVAPTVVSALNFLWIYDYSLGVLNYLLVHVFRILSRGVGWLSEPGTAMALRDRRQRLARLPVLRDQLPGRHEGDPRRAVRGGGGGRRDRGRALPPRDAPRHPEHRDHRGAALDDLDVQRLRDHLHPDQGRPRRRHPGAAGAHLRDRLRRPAAGRGHRGGALHAAAARLRHHRAVAVHARSRGR